MKIKTTIRNIGLAASATLMLAGCAADDDPVVIRRDASANAIVLGVDGVLAPETRAAQRTGIMNFSTLQKTGFGVYGYKGTYDSGSSLPTLFKDGANTKVAFYDNGTPPTTNLDIPGSWDYTGKDTTNLRAWEEKEKYTFFAYAPYVTAGDLATGDAPGITSVKTDTTSGDPTVGYTVATDPAKSVDLLWGVRSDTGLPWTDIQQGTTHSAVLFTFYHALCAIGLHAQVMVDQENDLDNLGDLSQLGTIGKEDGCKVTLKSITIKPAGTPFYQSAVLNLNNRTDAPPTNNAHQPKWSGYSGKITSLVLDGGSAAGHGTIENTLLDPKPDDFEEVNPGNYNVMNGSAEETKHKGIVESANTQVVIQNNDLYMLIPQAAQDYTIDIDYFLTYKTETGYNRQALSGTATVKGLELKAGVKYYLNLVFGLTTFKLTVDAHDWEEMTDPVTIATETGTSAGHSLSRRRGGCEVKDLR